MKNYKKGCILIIGQLRFHLLNKIFFENHKKDFDFFAVVDSNSEEKLNDLSFIKDSFIVEKNLKELNNQKKLLKIKDGHKLLQWQKLKIGYQLIEKYTKKNNIEYENFFKIRSDIFYENEMLHNLKINNNYFYMNTDYCFGSIYKNLSIISNFYLEAQKDFHNNFKYFNLNLSNLDLCDIDAARFYWLKYPYEIICKPQPPKNLKELTSKIFEYKNLITKAETNKFKIYCARKNWKNIIFPSEPSFLHFLLNKKFIVKRLFSNKKMIIKRN